VQRRQFINISCANLYSSASADLRSTTTSRCTMVRSLSPPSAFSRLLAPSIWPWVSAGGGNSSPCSCGVRPARVSGLRETSNAILRSPFAEIVQGYGISSWSTLPTTTRQHGSSSTTTINPLALLRGFSLPANYTDRATAACRRS
jgi:hypothetical protein